MVLVHEKGLRLAIMKEGEEFSYNYIGQKHFPLLSSIIFSCLLHEEECVLVKFQLHHSVIKKELELDSLDVKPLRTYDVVSVLDFGLHSANDINAISVTLAKSLTQRMLSFLI